jgi:predicted unusual protein kinase regulating ubiquinone biosynthesis (AarF/ABC1/UbiB family)
MKTSANKNFQNDPDFKGKPPRMRSRYWRVLFYFGRLTLSMIWWDILLRNLGLKALSRRTAAQRYPRWARSFRQLAIRLGGIWIKAGQFLSVRVDVLPESITRELSGLQDEVGSEDFNDIRQIIERELGASIEERYAEFEHTPLASASLGQVHRARLEDGRSVMVKVQRPAIRRIIATDLQAMSIVLGWLKRYRPVARRADLDALLEEFSRTVWEELDYLAEAQNARRFSEMFANDAGVRVPAVHDDLSGMRVLTLEDVYFIKITDYAGIEAAGIDRKEVAQRLIQTYLYQIFDEGFFHADPHPGNLFVEPDAENGWRLVFVDFGMVGHVNPGTVSGMQELLIALATRNPDRMITAYQQLGILLPTANLDRIRDAEEAIFDRFWGMSMSDLRNIELREMHDFAHNFRDLVYELPFQVPSDMIYLGRCMAILSGMSTGLDPDINVFEEIMPFAQKLVKDAQGDVLKLVLDWLQTQLRFWSGFTGRLDTLLAKVERGDLVVTSRPSPEMDQRLHSIERAINRLAGSVLLIGSLSIAAYLYLSGEPTLAVAILPIPALAVYWLFRR